MFKVIVCGGRDFDNYDLLSEKLNKLLSQKDEVCIVSGGAKGVDKLAIQYANKNKIKREVYIPDWKFHGKSAGYRRNELMSGKADAVVAFWDGESKGTGHMIRIMQQQRKPVRIIKY